MLLLAPGVLAIALAILTFAACIFLTPTARAATYKWVDDQGNVHYSDKMPPEAVNKGSIELNKQGVAIKKNDPALTPEQRRAREVEEERTRQAAKIRDEIQRRDRALLQTFTTEGEIDLSKKRALRTIDVATGEPAVVRVVEEHRRRFGQPELLVSVGEVGGDDAAEGEAEVAGAVEVGLRPPPV